MFFAISIVLYYTFFILFLLLFANLNIKIPYNTEVLDRFIDFVFIEIGNNTIISEESIIISSLVLADVLFIKKIIGAFIVITLGTVVEDFIYLGRPAKKWKKML
jgi:hypothetical protein